MDEQKLAPLFLRLAKGEREVVTTIYAETRAPLLAFFYRLCRSMDEAEDLLQNTFLSLWRYRVGYGGIDSARGYLYRVALHEWHRVLDRRKKRAGLTGEIASEPADPMMQTPSESFDQCEAAEDVRRAIDTLPEAQREAFLLHRFQGLSCREIAESMGESTKTIESRVRLALIKLTEKLRTRGIGA